MNIFVNNLIIQKMNKRGRPKKDNAIKSGQLKKGEKRFTFISTISTIARIKRNSKAVNMSIKDYLNDLINNDTHINSKEYKNEVRLKEYLKKGIK
jgi:hypothetical protein